MNRYKCFMDGAAAVGTKLTLIIFCSTAVALRPCSTVPSINPVEFLRQIEMGRRHMLPRIRQGASKPSFPVKYDPCMSA